VPKCEISRVNKAFGMRVKNETWYPPLLRHFTTVESPNSAQWAIMYPLLNIGSIFPLTMNSFSDIIRKVDLRFQCLLITNGAGNSPLPPLPAPFFFIAKNDALRLSSLSDSYVKLPVMVNVCSIRLRVLQVFVSK